MAICVICQCDCPPLLLSAAGVCRSCVNATPVQPNKPPTETPVSPQTTCVKQEEEVLIGRAVVRDVFVIRRFATVAGCLVTSGKITSSAHIRVLRGGVVVFPVADGKATLTTLKRLKDDVTEVQNGIECGLSIDGFNDVKAGDVIEAYSKGSD